jgi:hypothetical protein
MPTNDQIILNDFLTQKKNSIAPDIPDSVFFELYTSEQILKEFDLSWDELRAGVVGGGGDGGIDSFYTFVNGILLREDTEISQFKGELKIELYIIQSQKIDGFAESPILRLRRTAEDILDLSKDIGALESVYNKDLLGTIVVFRNAYRGLASKMPTLSIQYFYATMGTQVHPNVNREVETLRSTVTQLFSNAVFDFEFMGASRLLELARRVPTTTYQLRFVEAMPGEGGYVCLVPLLNYFKFITDQDGNYVKAIFDANVRDYQGDVQVNKGIRETLEAPGEEDFWWLNNGITIVADDAVSSGKTLTIKNPKVVNGMQTSLEITKHFATLQDPKDDRCILVRVISPQNEESHENIIWATNNQTSIPPASLKATDKIHRDIEDYLKPRGLFYERRKNYYKNEGKQVESIVGIPYLAQSLMGILLGRPDDARARPSTLLKKQEDYDRVFSDSYPLAAYESAIRIQKRCESFLRGKQPPLVAKEITNLRFFLSFAAARLLLKIGTISADDLSKINPDALSESLLSDAFEIIWSEYINLGADDAVAKSKELTRNISSHINTKL